MMTRKDRPGTRAGSGKGRRSRGRRSGTGDADERPAAFGLGSLNVVLLGTAALAIIGGYVLLDRGSVTAAPMLLVLGYVVLLPAGLLAGSGREED